MVGVHVYIMAHISEKGAVMNHFPCRIWTWFYLRLRKRSASVAGITDVPELQWSQLLPQWGFGCVWCWTPPQHIHGMPTDKLVNVGSVNWWPDLSMYPWRCSHKLLAWTWWFLTDHLFDQVQADLMAKSTEHPGYHGTIGIRVRCSWGFRCLSTKAQIRSLARTARDILQCWSTEVAQDH